MPPTIFFATNTGSQSIHADWIRRVCAEVNTPSFNRHFEIISCIKDNPLEILQEIQHYKKELIFFCFGGGDEEFQALLRASPRAGFGSLLHSLAQLSQLDLVFLSYCSRNIFVEPLLGSRIETVVGTSRHLPQAQTASFATVFCQQFLLAGQTTQSAYNQAVAQAAIRPNHRNQPFTELHGNPHLRLRRWWRFEPEPKIVGTPESRVVGQEASGTITLPPVPATFKLPMYPFPGARPYQAKDARIFFGREGELTRLYHHVTTSQQKSITVLCGQAGVGKTSLLRAGLLPRLQQGYSHLLLDGRKTTYLFDTLYRHIKPHRATITRHSWTVWLAKQKHDLLLTIDHVDRQLFLKNSQIQSDLAQFMKAIPDLIVKPAGGKRPKVIFCVREETLPILREFLAQHHLQSQTHEFLLKPLSESSVRNILSNFAPSTPLAAHYQCSIEDGLAAQIAADLTQDQTSSIAPFLQAILAKLEQEAANTKRTPRQLSRQQYQQLSTAGTLLSDFWEARLAKIRQQWPPILSYKKLIEVMAAYTSLAEAAKNRPSTTQGATQRIITCLKDFYLLTGKTGEQGNNLYLGHQLLERPIIQTFYLLSRDPTWFAIPRSALRFVTTRVRTSAARRYKKGKRKIWRSTAPFSRRPQLSRSTTWRLFSVLAIVVLLFLPYQRIYSRLRQLDFYTYIRNIYGGDTLSTAKATEPESSNSTKTAVSATPVQPDTPIALNRVALFYAHDLLPAYASQSRSTLAFSANSALLLAGGWDNTLEIWSIAEARRYPSLLVPTHATALTTMATQGNVLIYAAMDGGVNRLRLDAFGRIEPPQGNETWELLRHKGAVTAVQLTADGRWLVTGSQDGAVYQYDLQTNQSRTLRNDPTDPIAAVALNPTRPLVAYVGAKRSIALWHRMTEMVSSLPTEHTGSINTLQFSPDGLRIMTASSDGTVCIWQLANATRSHCFSDFTVGVNSALYTPDGALIVAAGNDGFIRVWDATSYRLLGAFNAHSGGVATLAMRADGRQLASAGWDGSIALWDLDLPSNLLKR